MTTNIPVLILMFNDSEFDLYKNKTFLPFIKSYLENYGIYRNTVFICNDEASKLVLKNNNVTDDNIFYSKNTSDHINPRTGLKYIYECLKTLKCDWFISVSLQQPIKNIDILYEGIRNISNKYDMIIFSTYTCFDESLEIKDNKVNPGQSFAIYPKRKIMDDSTFLTNKKFYMTCCENSNFTHERFAELYWKGHYYIVDNLDEIQMIFSSKQQIDNFIHFLNEIKYKKMYLK